MVERPGGGGNTDCRWKADWGDQEENTFESSLAATPLQRLEWLEDALELAQASGAISELRDDHASKRQGD